MGNLTFIPLSGPTLDTANLKAVRAHITQNNFAKRRQRLSREHAERKAQVTAAGTRQIDNHAQITQTEQVIDPLFASSHPDPRRGLSQQDASLIDGLTLAMEKLDLFASVSSANARSAMIQIDWSQLLLDRAMLDVSLYFSRLVDAARSPHQPKKLVADSYKGNALRSVRKRLGDGSGGLNDSLLAAVLILAILDQVLGDTDAWKTHVCGLLQIIAVRSTTLRESTPVWISEVVPHIILQEALLSARRDAALSTAIMQRGVLDPMFSDSNKDTALLIFANVEQVAAFQSRYEQTEVLSSNEQERLCGIIESLDQAIRPDLTGRAAETFLTAKALSIKIFLETVLRQSRNEESNAGITAVKLMKVLQEPQEQVSPLTLCATLGTLFWQTMMGAIAASNDRTRSFYTFRLQLMVAPLLLKSWNDALSLLQRFLWIPSIFSGPCQQVFSEIMLAQNGTNG